MAVGTPGRRTLLLAANFVLLAPRTEKTPKRMKKNLREALWEDGSAALPTGLPLSEAPPAPSNHQADPSKGRSALPPPAAQKGGMSGPWTGPGGVCRRPGPHERELRYPDETRALKLG